MTSIKRKYITAAALMAPALIIYTVFFILPIWETAVLSAFDWNGIPMIPRVFIGLQNYITMFSDPSFYNALFNSFAFIVTTVLVIMPASFLLAYIIFSGLRKSGLFKTIFYFPTILPMTATGLMWSIMLLMDGGAVNTVLGMLRLPSNVDWLGHQSLVIWTVTLVNAWMFIGQNMLFFLAGLSNISKDVLDAASIDGASGWSKMRSIILPGIRESFKIFLVLGISGSLKVFDIIFVMTGGGPGNASDVPATMLYKHSFIYRQFGYGSAIGVFILLSSVFVSFLLTKFFNKID